MKSLVGVSGLGKAKKTRSVSSETKLYNKKSISHSLSIKFSIKERVFLVDFSRKIVF